MRLIFIFAMSALSLRGRAIASAALAPSEERKVLRCMPDKISEVRSQDEAGVLGVSAFYCDGSLEPAAHDHLLLGIESDSVAAMSMQVAEERLLPAREREKRHAS